MDILADTNIILRRINRYDGQHKETRIALKLLTEMGHRVFIVPQNIIETWNVATRAIERNGLGLLPHQVLRIVASIEDTFTMIPDESRIYYSWKRLVGQYSVSGLKCYDARLVACASVNGIETILTFNGDDFRRYEGIKILHPRAVIQADGDPAHW